MALFDPVTVQQLPSESTLGDNDLVPSQRPKEDDWLFVEFSKGSTLDSVFQSCKALDHSESGLAVELAESNSLIADYLHKQLRQIGDQQVQIDWVSLQNPKYKHAASVVVIAMPEREISFMTWYWSCAKDLWEQVVSDLKESCTCVRGPWQSLLSHYRSSPL